MKKRFSDEQIISILSEAEAGVSARELCRKYAISDATYYTRRKKVCPCRPAVMMLSVHLLMYIYQGVSQNWRSNEGVLSGSYYVGRGFTSTSTPPVIL